MPCLLDRPHRAGSGSLAASALRVAYGIRQHSRLSRTHLTAAGRAARVYLIISLHYNIHPYPPPTRASYLIRRPPSSSRPSARARTPRGPCRLRLSPPAGPLERTAGSYKESLPARRSTLPVLITPASLHPFTEGPACRQSAMETATQPHHFSSPAALLDQHMDSNTSPPQYLKMEDLQSGSSPSPASFDNAGAASTQASPPPVIIQSKPAKKRKSWGQELPEPKTTLPPRKRAKTDDEKEQRRIERIKRNRAAAHNSRERKRQEAETLAVLLARANAELEAYRRLHGPLPSDVVLPEVQLCTEGYVPPVPRAIGAPLTSSDSSESTPAPSLVASRGSIDAAASPASPADTVTSTYPTIKQEPTDLPTTIAPPAFEALDPKSASLPHLDETQHSAEMLCDLQCPSSLRRSRTSNPTPTSSSPSSTCQASSWWTSIFTTLLAFQLRTCYQQILLAIWTLSPSRMERMIRASTTRLAAATRSRSTTSSTRMPSLSRSTTPLAQLKAATGVATREGARTALDRHPQAAESRTPAGDATGANPSSSVYTASRDDSESGQHPGGNDDGVSRR